MDAEDLAGPANALVAPGKGILAADESDATIAKRFKSKGIPNTLENRHAYREMLFTTPEIESFISGIILFDETIRQQSSEGEAFPQLLARRGIIPGIKVDKGAKPLAGSPGETVTEGLDGLRERLAEYRMLGARFTKWRATISIGEGKPSSYCLSVNAHALARFAKLSQEAGLVPIVEPEVLMDGGHSLDDCERVTTITLQRVFDELFDHGVSLEGTLLKTNMIVSGAGSGRDASPDEVAEATIKCFRRVVPAALPGIVFLSGGQSDRDATERLNAVNKRDPAAWATSFSFSRALQAPALQAWSENRDKDAAQNAFLLRAKCNGAATKGAYRTFMELQPA